MLDSAQIYRSISLTHSIPTRRPISNDSFAVVRGLISSQKANLRSSGRCGYNVWASTVPGCARLFSAIGVEALAIGRFQEQPCTAACRGESEMPTGKKPASKASKELKSSKSTASEKTVAASDLAQAKTKPKKKTK